MKQMWLEDAGTSADPRDTRIVCDCGAGEAYAFENSCETLPRTPLDLQRLLLARLSDLQHSLLHDDFAQGPTVCSLTSERAGQNWMADHLRRSQGRSYSIEREPHVVGEKEPDIRARSKANDASMPIEIKVAESWPLDKLEEALVDQLCGRYLRSRGPVTAFCCLFIRKHVRAVGLVRKMEGRWTSLRSLSTSD
jgi:hypothetical protein